VGEVVITPHAYSSEGVSSESLGALCVCVREKVCVYGSASPTVCKHTCECEHTCGPGDMQYMRKRGGEGERERGREEERERGREGEREGERKEKESAHERERARERERERKREREHAREREHMRENSKWA